MAREGLVDAFFAGNRRTLRFTVYNDDPGVAAGTKLSLVGLTAKFTLSTLFPDGSYALTALLQKATGGAGITITDAAGGVLEVTLDPDDTVDLAGDYHFQLEVFDGGGAGLVVATGTVTIRRNVANT